MNIQLKSKILENSITIEYYLSDILKILLGIEDTENKTLGHKGTSLSFKSKVDLLFDINKIDKPLYNNLIMFMEIRNQFIHNFDTDSFGTVLSRINKKEKLLTFDKNIPNYLTDLSDEERMKFCFDAFFIELLKSLGKTRTRIMQDNVKAMEEKLNLLTLEQDLKVQKELMKIFADSIDETIDYLNNHFSNNEFGQFLNKNNRLTRFFKSHFFRIIDEKTGNTENQSKGLNI